MPVVFILTPAQLNSRLVTKYLITTAFLAPKKVTILTNTFPATGFQITGY